jgi:adenylate kinase
MKELERQKEIQIIEQWLGTGSINIFGMPFAGKDTHSHTLAEQLDGVVLGGGDILRNSVIPEHVQKKMDAGELAPTDEYIQIVLPYLSRPEFASKPLILSSVGRWHGEEEGVISVAKASGHELKAVVLLHVSQEVALERWEHSQKHLTRGERADDQHHKLDVRFAEFHNKTEPVIEFYRQTGLLIEIDGTPEIARVTQDIIEALVEFAKNH